LYQPVFVLDANGKPLAPCHPARARQLLENGKAEVMGACPFSIRLKRVVPDAKVEAVDLKIDSGAKHVGFALVAESGRVFLMGQLDLRTDIKERLDWRRACRRSRRNRKTRYRQPRFDNRRKPDGWLPPSLKSRVDTTVKLAKKLSKIMTVKRIVVETATFDMHRLLNPEVCGVKYQQGPLFRTDIRRYLFEKFKGKCAYCRKNLGKGWQADHVIPKSRGGSDRVWNRVAACEECNQMKANRTAAEFGHPEVEAMAHRDYSPAAIIGSIKTSLVCELSKIDPTIETDGVLTSRNRKEMGLDKSHANDAVVLLDTKKSLVLPSQEAFFVARPCGTRRLANGPNGSHTIRLPREVKGFRQWDVARWNGRVCYIKGRRKTGFFLISDIDGNKIKDSVSARRMMLVHRASTLQGLFRRT
jgi:5-methylcytosine-specific restriction endonuclease McrA